MDASRRTYWKKIVGNWWGWARPTGPFLGPLSSVAFVLGAIPFIVLLTLKGVAGLTDAANVAFVVTGVLALSGLTGGALLLFFGAAYETWRQDVTAFDETLGQLAPLRDYRDSQQGHEQEWLRLVVEEIDLASIRGQPDKVRIKFQIDSGLVYEFRPHRVQVILRVNSVTNEAWELPSPPNLLAGKRSQLATELIPLIGDAIRKQVSQSRQEGQALAGLEVHVTLRSNEQPVSVRGDSEARTYVVRRDREISS